MYHHVFVAGTFDSLHRGHQALLTRAFSEGERVTVGITPDAFVLQTKGISVKPFEARKKVMEDFLQQKGWASRATIIPIIDQYEPAASDGSLDALIVTSQNKKTGEEINSMRVSKGLPVLTLIEVAIVSAGDDQPISSTRIRNGEITPSGKLILPDNLRPELAKPLGLLLSGATIAETLQKRSGRIVITVGDVVTKTFLDAGITPHLAIVDLRIGRKPATNLSDFSQKGTRVASGPGFISKGAIAAIGTWAETLGKEPLHREVILIDGEEDLLVLPVLLAAPLESLVYYGQPNQGMVEIEVTIGKKKEMTELFKKFTQG